jgi:CelD/BcsL family acetyltransferase involved in cellulose biosynthesis
MSARRQGCVHPMSADASNAADTIALEVVPSTEAVAVGELWRALEDEVGCIGFACSWAWTETWLAHFGDILPHEFAVGHVDGRPCGIALLVLETQRRGGLVRVRRLHFGTAGAPRSDDVYVCSNRLLAAPAHQHGFAAAVLRAVMLDRRWDEIALDRFAPDAAAPLVDAWPEWELLPERCPVLDLTAADETDGDVVATLRSTPRHQIRRSIRGLGAVTTEVARTPAQALDILEELIDLHQRRWARQGEPGAFASSHFTAFHKAVVPRLSEQDAAMLVRIRTDSRTVGCVYHLVDGTQVLAYAMGLADIRERKVKPGFVTLAACMQACYDRDLREYNHLPEPTAYKLELSNSERHFVTATTGRRRMKLLVIRGLRKLKRRRGGLVTAG